MKRLLPAATIVTAVGILTVGMLLAFPRPDPRFRELSGLVQRVTELELRAEAAEARRCVQITTPVVNVDVYSTPSLGTRPANTKPSPVSSHPE